MQLRQCCETHIHAYSISDRPISVLIKSYVLHEVFVAAALCAYYFSHLLDSIRTNVYSGSPYE